MRVLYFHQYFGTPKGASGTRSYEMARALIARGHEVDMVCASADRSDSGLETPFVNGRRDGVVDGVRVTEFDLGYSNADSLLVRGWKFVRYALKSIGVALARPCDLVFATSTPLTAALPGVAAKVVRGKPFVFEVRDLWPELPIAMGMKNPLVIFAMRLLERTAYAFADQAVALAPGIRDGIAARGVLAERIALVPNGCDFELFDGVESEHPSVLAPDRIEHGDLVAVFTGAHGKANGLDAVVAAARELDRRGRTDIRLLLIGSGSEKARLMSEAEGVRSLVFADPLPKRRLAAIVRGADVGLQILADVEAFREGTSPNKFFDYLAARKPVLINYPGWLARFVEDAGCGWVCPPGDAGAMADALEAAAADRAGARARGEAGRAAAERAFGRADLASAFAETLEAANACDQARRALRAPLKRLMDVTLAAAALVLLSPVIAVVALMVRAKLGSPVLFRQVRPGLAGRPFRLLKFRTMRDATDREGNPLPDEARLTAFGRMLRATSLDELPSLWNIVRGDLSLVGPRPLLMEYLPLYSPEQARRHAVRPGLTGWAQVNGRNAVSWPERFRLDVWYVDNRTLGLDLKIILMTVGKVLKRESVSAADHVTMPRFTGREADGVSEPERP